MIVSSCAPCGGQTVATSSLIRIPLSIFPDRRSVVGDGPAQLTPVTLAVPSKCPEPSIGKSGATAWLQTKLRRTPRRS